jgi:hypothetical protein
VARFASIKADDGRVLHLCADVGLPVVWRLGDFARHERYRVFIGAKRPRVNG